MTELVPGAPPDRLLPTVPVLGTPVVATTFERALETLLAAPREGWRLRAHFATAHMLVEANRDPALHATLASADLVFPDGMPLVWIARRRQSDEPVGRVCGPDILPALVARSTAEGRRHYFYGGAPGVAEELARRLAERHPGLTVAGIESPPFRPLTADEERTVAERINASGADYVWVGLGSPKQEHWVARFRPDLEASVLLAVGAAFDFHAGSKRRAPLWMQRTGTEWLFRLVSEPRRLAARYTKTNLQFAWLALRESLHRRRGRS